MNESISAVFIFISGIFFIVVLAIIFILAGTPKDGPENFDEIEK